MSDNQLVTVIRFTKTGGGNYRAGDEAAFDDTLAQEWVRLGWATIVKRNVPRVDPRIAEHDAHEREAALRMLAETGPAPTVSPRR
jgi:hypothetical protein